MKQGGKVETSSCESGVEPSAAVPPSKPGEGNPAQSDLDTAASSKSSRSAADAMASEIYGTACTRVDERMLAALGKSNGAVVSFEKSLDVPNEGVLAALPALLENGLLLYEEERPDLDGYYRRTHILLLLGGVRKKSRNDSKSN